MKKHILKTHKPLLPFVMAIVASLLFLSCDSILDGEKGNGLSGQVFLQLHSNTFNSTDENQVKEIRFLAFKQGLGTVMYNELLEFPEGLNSPSKLVGLDPGIYDFLFVANESGYPDLTTKLEGISNISNFNDEDFFKKLPYKWGFTPSEKTPFLMSAYYPGIELKKEHTQKSPLRHSIFLVRAFAKVELEFINNQDLQPGEESKKIEKLVFKNIPEYFTLPGATFNVPTHTGTLGNYEVPVDLGDDFYNTPNATTKIMTFYIPEFLRKPGETPVMPTWIDIVGKDGGNNDLNARLFLQMPEDNVTVWNEIDQMAIPKLSSELINPISVVRNSNYKAKVCVTERGLDVFIYFWVDYYGEPIPIELYPNAPSIVNIDRREVYLDLITSEGITSWNGVLYFNFGGTTYMEYVGAQKTLATNADDHFGFTPESFGQGYRLDLKFQDFTQDGTVKQGYFYLLFRNTTLSDQSKIAIKIKLHTNKP